MIPTKRKIRGKFEFSSIHVKKKEIVTLDHSKYLSIDLGISNFTTLVDTDETASIVDGKYIISLNQLYNKGNGILQSIKALHKIKEF